MNVKETRRALRYQFNDKKANLLYIHIASRANSKGVTIASGDQLAQWCCISRPLIVAAMKWLQHRGAITVSTGDFLPYTITLTPSLLAKGVDTKPDTP